MHELSIAMSIVDMAEEEAARHHGRVAAVHLKLGPLSGVVKEALLGAFELAREGSALADSTLIVEEVAVTAYCPACAVERPIESFPELRCPDLRGADAPGRPRPRAGSRRPGDRRAMNAKPRIIQVRERVLKQNDILARDLRVRFAEAGVFVVSLVSSPGSGKTAFLEKTLTLLKERCRVAALVGDLATDNDARRLARSGAPVKQIITGTVCHLDAEMVAGRRPRLAVDGPGLPVHRERGQSGLSVFFRPGREPASGSVLGDGRGG